MWGLVEVMVGGLTSNLLKRLIVGPELVTAFYFLFFYCEKYYMKENKLRGKEKKTLEGQHASILKIILLSNFVYNLSTLNASI